ncbi:MAG: hypothetical protein KDC85_09200 [Saprospiraceae bacterium]|nr:hypothetical protein [Saprospiraceae bacterium]
MKFSKLFFLFFLFNVWCFTITAQDMDQLVTLACDNQPLGNVLNDISTNYQVKFTYSRDFIPMDHPVTVAVQKYPLHNVLDLIFAPTPIVYKNIGGNIALRVDETKLQQLTQLQKLPLPDEVHRQKRLKESKAPKKLPIRNTQVEQAPGGDRMVDFDPSRFIIPEISHEPYQEEAPIIQVSLFSMKQDWDLLENVEEARVLIDVLGGNHKKINGVNIGGGVNNIHHDVKGVQIGGLGNKVSEEVKGVQAAGLFNEVNGNFTGLQAAGIYNRSRCNFLGLQIAGGVNIANQKAEAIQIAGLVNYAGSGTKTQLSGLANIAGDVDWSQTSSLFNKAKEVKGFQVGLINVADTVALGAYGLLNIIRRGYNRIELSGSEVLYTNLAFKFGTKQFYNIFHFGARWDQFTGGDQQGSFMSWGLGYGLGTCLTISPRELLNIEVVAIHLNELEAWTNELNLLNQLRVTYDVRVGRKLSLFGGPVANIYISRPKPDSDPAGKTARFAPYTFYEGADADANLKVWVGIQAGIRF